MKIGMPDWPSLEEPIVVEHDGWWAAWHGGRANIDVFPSEVGAKRDALGTNPMDGNYAVATIGTEGDEFDPEDPEDYVRSELRGWVRTDAQYY